MLPRMRRPLPWSASPLGAALLLLAACGDDTSSTGGGGSGGSGSSSSATTASGSTASTTSASTGAGEGGDEPGTGGGATAGNIGTAERPVELRIPEGYDEATPTPLIILLHGYGATGEIQDLYFGMSAIADEHGFLFAAPDGTVDATSKQFWNATDACCDFAGTGVDDSGYLEGLVETARLVANVDPKRIYFVGHSNGGFMSYRMACDHADTVAAIASLAGATYAGDECDPSEPVATLQIHGTDDETIAYEGGNVGAGTGDYPGAEVTVELWAGYDGCDLDPTAGDPRDVSTSIDGEESTVEIYDQGCDPHGAAELWTVPGGSHIPALSDTFAEQVVEWLFAHPKP